MQSSSNLLGRVKEFSLLSTPLQGSDRWDRHLFLKHDENRQRKLFKFALLATRLRITFAVSNGKLNLCTTYDNDDDE